MSFTWGTSNVKKNFFSIYAKKEGSHTMSGYATTALAIDGLKNDGFEEVGSCKSEPAINTTAQDGIENNKGSTIGASKEAAIEIVLMQLTDDNYAAATALDGEEVTFVYIEETRGITYVLADLVADVNLNTVGNSYEELPITAKKEAAEVGSMIVRHTIGETSIVGMTKAVEITAAGNGYQAADVGSILSQTDSTGSGSGVKVMVTSVDGADGLQTLALVDGGSGHSAVNNDVIELSLGTAAGVTHASVTVRAVVSEP